MSSENQIYTSSVLRIPRAIVEINGMKAIFDSIEVDSTTFFQADSFSVTIPASGQIPQLSLDYFSSVAVVLVEIYLGFPSDPNNFVKQELDNMITGQVDDIQIDFIRRSITLSGRDLAAKFIDNKTTQKYPNLTSSQIVEKLAAKEGLAASVTPTKTQSGIYYANNHATLTSELTEWDLLIFLAQNENFMVYVKGQTVYFHPKPAESSKPYSLQYNAPNDTQGYSSFSGMSLKCSRSNTVAKDVTIKVRSWNSSLKKAFTVTVQSSLKKKVTTAPRARIIGNNQVYSFVKPGLTKEQALRYAQNKAKQLTQHERNIQAQLPADNILSKLSVIKLSGTNTDYDQVYYPSRINRTFDTGQYMMTISAKNHSPNSEVVF